MKNHLYEKPSIWRVGPNISAVLGARRWRPACQGAHPTISTSKQTLLIIVSPHVGSNGTRHPSDFDCWLEGGTFLCTSRQPFLQAARVLKAMGYQPDTTLVMRHAGSNVVALRGRLGIAAGLTVDEYNGTRFAPWKPFPGLAG